MELLGLILVLIILCLVYIFWRAYRLHNALHAMQKKSAKLGEEIGEERNHYDPTGDA